MSRFPHILLRPSRFGALFLALLFGCAVEFGTERLPLSSPAVGSAEAAPAPLSEGVFATGLARISEIYLTPVDLARVVIDGLETLHTLDGSLHQVIAERSLKLRRGSRLLGAFALPETEDTGIWATFAVRVIERARAASPTLREITPDQIYQSVFEGILARLDPYSRYSPPQRASNERAMREGYGGVGLTLKEVAPRYLVSDLVRGGPADRAGLKVGETIEAVDGLSTVAMNMTQVRDALRGPPGSTVQLMVSDANNPSRVLVLHRERVIPNTVRLTVERGTAILRIERFNIATASNVREAVQEARRRGAAPEGDPVTGYILDLRGNPGGLLDQAVAVADLFIRQGRIISTAGRHPDSWQRFDTSGNDIIPDFPLVVLIDGRSASASEIVAAALQDNGRAVLVGASSFGKGSVQTVTRLPNDAELFLTWARIYAPSGYTLHRQGVQPTLCTSREDTTPEALLSPLRAGRLDQPEDLRHWRAAAPDDETALSRLRQFCPWKAHEPEIDVRIARALLSSPPLYRSALALSSTHMAER